MGQAIAREADAHQHAVGFGCYRDRLGGGRRARRPAEFSARGQTVNGGSAAPEGPTRGLTCALSAQLRGATELGARARAHAGHRPVAPEGFPVSQAHRGHRCSGGGEPQHIDVAVTSFLSGRGRRCPLGVVSPFVFRVSCGHGQVSAFSFAHGLTNPPLFVLLPGQRPRTRRVPSALTALDDTAGRMLKRAQTGAQALHVRHGR
jgi:hypothetical protein